MDFKKCERCGCFFTTDSSICPKCEPKDKFEMNILKDYLCNNIELNSVDNICIDTGISKKNLNRFLKNDDFTNCFNNDNNIKINL